jgi:poly(A) polymerase
MDNKGEVILNRIKEKIEGVEVYVVGGTVRDILLGRKATDFDLVIRGKPSEIVARITSLFPSATFFSPGKESNLTRVVFGNRGERYNIDIAMLRGKTIEEDLLDRDFTINAMAFSLNEQVEDVERILIDPSGGRFDLEREVIRAVSEDGFVNDPIRLLRAFRFAVSLGFKIEKATLDSISKRKDKIKLASGERLSFELITILKEVPCYPVLEQAKATGLLYEILHHFIPCEAKWVALFPLRRLEEVISTIDRDFPRFSKKLTSALSEEIAYDRPRLPLLKLISMLFVRRGEYFLPPGEEAIKKLAERFRLSRREGRFLLKLREGYLSLMTRFPDFTRDRKEMFRFLKKAGDGIVFALILLAAIKEEVGSSYAGRMLEAYYGFYLPALSAPLFLNGDELIHHFNLPRGRLIGELIEALREAQALGLVNSKKKAILYVERFIHDYEKRET